MCIAQKGLYRIGYRLSERTVEAQHGAEDLGTRQLTSMTATCEAACCFLHCMMDKLDRPVTSPGGTVQSSAKVNRPACTWGPPLRPGVAHKPAGLGYVLPGEDLYCCGAARTAEWASALIPVDGVHRAWTMPCYIQAVGHGLCFALPLEPKTDMSTPPPRPGSVLQRHASGLRLVHTGCRHSHGRAAQGISGTYPRASSWAFLATDVPVNVDVAVHVGAVCWC